VLHSKSLTLGTLMDATDFQLILVDPIPELCEQFELYFRDFASVVCGPFQELPDFDCMVSPANSFGLMDGGVDLAIIRFFGIELMDRVQEHILQEFRGEQPVGTCCIIPTAHAQHPFLAHAPTMRIPMAIARTDNVYRAMSAMLLAVWQHNRSNAAKIRKVACPGLGTATGQVSFRSAAKQMALAYQNFLAPPKSISWPHAISRQQAIGLGGDESFHTNRREE
jgi:O-acetyl-ADP-ribose deacetylase (regulator of RNase III)